MFFHAHECADKSVFTKHTQHATWSIFCITCCASDTSMLSVVVCKVYVADKSCQPFWHKLDSILSQFVPSTLALRNKSGRPNQSMYRQFMKSVPIHLPLR